LQLSLPCSAQSAPFLRRRLGALYRFSVDNTLTLSAEPFLPFLLVVLIRMGVETKEFFKTAFKALGFLQSRSRWSANVSFVSETAGEKQSFVVRE
jgi:hypothetical protein